MKEIEFILYVAQQERSKIFYEQLLMIPPSLHVPGMTEFRLSESTTLGLMPEKGIAKIIGNKLPHPTKGSGIPRCELYLKVDNPLGYMERGIALGGKEISPLQPRDWGDAVGYIADLDGHVLAFADADYLDESQ